MRIGFTAATPNNITPVLTVGNNNVQLGANGNPINFTSTWHASPDAVNNVSELCNDTANYKCLMIVGNRSAGMGRRVAVWDRFEVNGIFVNNSSQEHKQDISELSDGEYRNILSKIDKVPVFHYRFRAAGIDSKIRLGVIAEQSPEEILDESGKAVSFLDYAGFLLAGIKAERAELRAQEARLAAQEASLAAQREELSALAARLDRIAP